MAARRVDEGESIESAVEGLDEASVRLLLAKAAARHEDVAQAVRLARADEGERLDELRAMVDDRLRTRRHLDYWASSSWAAEAGPVVEALAEEAAVRPSAQLVVLLQRAAGHLVKAILRADDSNGSIGDLTRWVLALHREACAAGVADPTALAKWMVRFSFEDQDFFEIDPVAYVDALGDKGLAAYRREVARRSAPVDEPDDRSPFLPDRYGGFPSYAAMYAAQRLAVIDRDDLRLIELLGGDLTGPHQFERVAQAMVELDQPDEALAWARRGIAETDGWHVAKLYDLAAELLAGQGDVAGVVELRRHHHERAASSSTYAELQAAARKHGSWEGEMASARAGLAERDPAGYIDALLADHEPDEAWTFAADSQVELYSSQWLRLAQAREVAAPADAMAVYLRLADESLETADKRAYQAAVRLLRAARSAAVAADRLGEFKGHLADLREQHRRRPTLMTMLDKAKLA